jgi:hypothetical protein
LIEVSMMTANEFQAQQACLTATLCLIRATQIVSNARESGCQMNEIDALAHVLMSAQLALKNGLASRGTQAQAATRAVPPCALLAGGVPRGIEDDSD